jgi:hypothetical protein
MISAATTSPCATSASPWVATNLIGMGRPFEDPNGQLGRKLCNVEMELWFHRDQLRALRSVRLLGLPLRHETRLASVVFDKGGALLP